MLGARLTSLTLPWYVRSSMSGVGTTPLKMSVKLHSQILLKPSKHKILASTIKVYTHYHHQQSVGPTLPVLSLHSS